MKSIVVETLRSSLVVGLTIAVVTGPLVAGSPPDNLSDLYHQDQGWTESQLRSRGYSLQHTDRHGSSRWQYWWSGGRHTCLQIEFDRNYKVAGMNTTSSTDCNQYHSEATKEDKNAAIAIGAVALIGGLLAHKSHHREGRHGDDSRSVAEFERGYRDGLHREDYHNYNNSDAYTDGYNEGVDERHEQTSYRSRHSGTSGYRSHVSVNDLVGAHGESSGSLGRVTLYRDGDYRGTSESFDGDIPDMRRTRIGNDKLSSMRIPRGCRVTVYADVDYGGRAEELSGDVPEMSRTRIGNDQASSLRVSCR